MRRPRGEMLARILLAVLVAGMGYASVTAAFAFTQRRGDAARAHALAPGDGRITALAAQSALVSRADGSGRGAAERLARLALRQDPTAPGAASTLAATMQMQGDGRRAARLLAYARRLSRRDFQAQLLSIEAAVARGDVAGALTHYDIALRTTRTAPEILFPVLAAAIDEPAIRTGLVATLARRPEWSGSFTDYVAGRGADPRGTASLFAMLHRAGIPVSPGARGEVINLLVARDLTDAAWAFYASFRPGADRRRSRDPRFTADPGAPTILDWIAADGTGGSGSIQRGEDGGVFDFALPPGLGGILLQQMQMLPAGAYRLEGRSEGIEQPQRTRPYWVLSCRNGGELGRIMVPAGDRGGAFAGRFDVPANCPVQTLALVARPSDLPAGVAGRITRVAIGPLG